MKKYWILFHDGALLVQREENGWSLPCTENAPLPVEGLCHEIGEWKGIPCVAMKLAGEVLLETLPNNDPELNLTPVVLPPVSQALVGLRNSHGYLPLKGYRLAERAAGLLFWDENTQYCGVCGTKNELDTAISKHCPSCGKLQFPSINPAILAMVRRDDKILLVHARNFSRDFHSLVAGFLESGETFEECVAREIREETTLEVTNIRYFGSQEWPYPSGIMVGFICDYVSGEICFADQELTSGDFYGPIDLPLLPQKLSLARIMIDAWLAGDIN
ncbi:MAG: NAD(+) diphosphatase [Bacteroidaceae bacterium]